MENAAPFPRPPARQLDDLADVAAALAGLARAITSLRRLACDSAKLRVLLVQHDPDLRASLRRALRETQHQVTDALDFADALVHLASDAFDAVITDEHIGNTGSGRTLLAEVRRRWPFVRRILCSAAGGQLVGSLDPDVVERLLALPVEEQVLRACLL